jgi:pyruvate-formate lyase-activating enzyme
VTYVIRRARLIITLDCNRKCSNCCNDYIQIMERGYSVTDLGDLREHQTISITGGEPLLDVDHTLAVIDRLDEYCPHSDLYLYTALYTPRVGEVLDRVEGATFTLHAEATAADIRGFELFQHHILGRDGSYRAYINKAIEHSVCVVPSIWDKVELMERLSEKDLLVAQPHGLPEGEDLYFLEK